MLNRLSTGVVALTSLVLGVAAFGACVDPEKRFDEFHDRVPIVDASLVDRMPLQISDIEGGEFYLAIRAVNFNNTLHLLATWDLNLNEATLSGEFQPLSAPQGDDDPPRLPVGTKLTSASVPVDDTATFVAPIAGTIDGQANPISGSPLGSQVRLVGTIRTADLVCGTVMGTVCLGTPAPCDPGVSVEPATFAAVRVTAADWRLPNDQITVACPP